VHLFLVKRRCHRHITLLLVVESRASSADELSVRSEQAEVGQLYFLETLRVKSVHGRIKFFKAPFKLGGLTLRQLSLLSTINSHRLLHDQLELTLRGLVEVVGASFFERIPVFRT